MEIEFLDLNIVEHENSCIRYYFSRAEKRYLNVLNPQLIVLKFKIYLSGKVVFVP